MIKSPEGLRCLFTPPGGEDQLDPYGRWVLETLYTHASVSAFFIESVILA
jgi:hypothetical protein